jgi:thioredoxin reductase (NADPH)
MGICSKFDVVIVGGGPAGMGAALWCDELGLSSCLLEKSGAPGGQLSWIHNPIRNYLGAEFRDGAECLERFKASISDRRFELFPNVSAFSIVSETREVITSVGSFSGKAIVIASGVRRRELSVPGEAEFRGRGILDSGSGERQSADGLDVAVVGGGDAALENALILAEFANKVYIIHRRGRFSAREEFIRAVSANPKIECMLETNVEQFGGENELEFVDTISTGGPSRRSSISKAVVRIGVVPNSELLFNAAELDDRGYVRVDYLGRTSAKGIYAIGDVANQTAPTIASAVGAATTAIKSIAESTRNFE